MNRGARPCPRCEAKIMSGLPIDSQAIQKACMGSGVKRLDLFGSFAKGTAAEGSDVDVLVTFDRAGGRMFGRYFELKEKLEEIFGRPVDLVVEDSIRNPYFRQSIEESRLNVFSV